MSFEQWLDLLPEILDLSFLAKYFTRLWSSKYRTRLPRTQVFDRCDFQFNEMQLVWTLSDAPVLLALKMKNTKSANLPCPFLKEGELGMAF